MKKLFTILILSIFTLVGTVNLTAKPLLITGKYTGLRNVSEEHQKKLEKLSKKHFKLLQAGKTAKAAKYYSEAIAPLKNKISQAKAIKGGKLDFFVMSYTREAICMSGVFPQRNKKEHDAGWDNLVIDCRFKAADFLRIFESSENVKIKFQESGDDITVWAKGTLKSRDIHIKREYRVDGGPVRKTALFKMKIENEKLVSINMFKQKKYTFSIGFKTVFAGFMDLTRTETGMLLKDETFEGRVNTSKKVKEATVKPCTPKDFKKIINSK